MRGSVLRSGKKLMEGSLSSAGISRARQENKSLTQATRTIHTPETVHLTQQPLSTIAKSRTMSKPKRPESEVGYYQRVGYNVEHQSKPTNKKKKNKKTYTFNDTINVNNTSFFCNFDKNKGNGSSASVAAEKRCHPSSVAQSTSVSAARLGGDRPAVPAEDIIKFFYTNASPSTINSSS